MMDIDGNMRVWKSPARGEYYDLSLFWSQNGTYVERVVKFIWIQMLSWHIKPAKHTCRKTSGQQLHVLVSLPAKLFTPWKNCWMHIPSPVNVILMARHTIVMEKAYDLKVCIKLWKFRSWICIFHLCWKLIDEVISYVLGQVKKKPHVSL